MLTKFAKRGLLATGHYHRALSRTTLPGVAVLCYHGVRDDRMATVVSGNWQFGYGTHFDESALKILPPGSVYSEPGGLNHFARTTDVPVVVHICGFGPTDTRYFNPADDPESMHKK